MLEFIRKGAGSIVVKILFGFLIAGFVVWGVGDVVRIGASIDRVARVGGVDIRPEEVEDALKRELDMLQRLLGRNFDREQARAMGLARSALDAIVERALYGLAATDLGVAVSDRLVGQEIQGNEAFRGPSGAFDRLLYQQALQNAGLPAARFERSVRDDMVRSQLLDTIKAIPGAPATLVDPLFRYRLEKRIAETFFVAADTASGIGDPTDEDLARFHRDNASRFTAPSYRALTVALLEAEDLTREIAVSPDKVRQTYAERQAEYVIPERRRLLHMVLADAAQAAKARDMVAGGRDFVEVAKEVADIDKDAADLGSLARKDIETQLPEVAEAAFTLADGGLAGPIKSPLGFHLVKVAGVERGHTKALDDVKDEIGRAIARDMAVEALVKLGNKLEDGLGGGARLEEAAAKVGAKVLKFDAVDATGRGPDGKAVANLPAATRFLDVAFEIREGVESGLTETDRDGYFVLRVDRVKAAELKPLATVRDEVVAAWKAERRDAAAKKTAEGYVERAKQGAALAALAGEAKLELVTTGALTRQPGDPSHTLPQALIAALFAIKPGETTMAKGTGGYHVARLKDVRPADPGADRADRDTVARQLARAIESDILSQYLRGLRERYPVTVDERALEKLL